MSLACLANCLYGARAVLYADDDDDRTQGLLCCCTLLLGLLWPLRLIRMQHAHPCLQIEVQGVKAPDAVYNSVLDTLHARAAHDTPLCILR
jgi:hypothetical protein